MNMFQLEQQNTSDFGPCECCGSMSRLVSGLIKLDEETHAAFQIHWTLGKIEKHGAGFYIVLGYWGDGTVAADRYAVGLRYRCDAEATGFMVVDAEETSIASNPLVGRALRRDEVVGTPLAQEIFDIVEFIWLNDDRITEITAAHRARQENGPDVYEFFGVYQNEDARLLLDAFATEKVDFTLDADKMGIEDMSAFQAANGGTFGAGVGIVIGVHINDCDKAMTIRQRVLKIVL